MRSIPYAQYTSSVTLIGPDVCQLMAVLAKVVLSREFYSISLHNGHPSGAFAHLYGGLFCHVLKPLSDSFSPPTLALFALQRIGSLPYCFVALVKLHTVWDPASRQSLPFRHKISQREVVYHILNLLHIVFDAIASPPKRVVFQIEDLEAGVEVLDKPADLKWPLIIA